MKNKKFTILFLFLAVLIATLQFSFAGKSNTPLSEKEILSALLASQDVLLKDAAHCKGVGTNENDRSIGEYLSGFWAFHANQKGKNWLDITSKPSDKGTYLAKVMIYRKDGEENWGWGVSFKIGKNGKALRDSFTCLGAG